MNHRDYVPKKERNLKERMDEGASVKDGLAGRATTQRDGAHYRTYIGEDGKPDPMKKYKGAFDND